MGTQQRAGTSSGMTWTCVEDVLDVLLAGGRIDHGDLGVCLLVLIMLYSPTKYQAPEQGPNLCWRRWVEHCVCVYVCIYTQMYIVIQWVHLVLAAGFFWW